MKDVILSAVGAAIGLYALSLVEDNVLNSINNNLACVAAPLAATAVMIFSTKQAADAKSIVGYVYRVSLCVSPLLSLSLSLSCRRWMSLYVVSEC